MISCRAFLAVPLTMDEPLTSMWNRGTGPAALIGGRDTCLSFVGGHLGNRCLTLPCGSGAVDHRWETVKPYPANGYRCGETYQPYAVGRVTAARAQRRSPRVVQSFSP